MKNILIIYPHWPPSNLAGVHRPRLIANNLKDFDWHPIVLTVHEKYYEELPDYDLVKLVQPEVEVIKTKAFPLMKPRIIGDIGLRAFPYLYRSALNILRTRKIDFVWIPVPSFYVAILGRILHRKTGVPYGIDYIDPWIRDISNRRNLRSIFSNVVAGLLEPYALKKASLISGVSEGYYKPAIKRVFGKKEIKHVAMPYGFDPIDHKIVLNSLSFPWGDLNKIKPIVYAGALLPNSVLFLECMMAAVKKMKSLNQWPEDVKFYFIGVGSGSSDLIFKLAEKFNISDYFLFTERRPYLEVLNLLKFSYANLVLGSTEKHYTASKIFQNLLSGKPVISVFNSNSSAVEILKECKADTLSIKYNEDNSMEDLTQEWIRVFRSLFSSDFIWDIELDSIEKYSSQQSARLLSQKMNEIVR